MSCEILDYRYSTEWNLDKILSNLLLTSNVEPNWALVTSSLSAIDEYNLDKVWQQYLNGARRAKPSLLNQTSQGSVSTLAGKILNLKGQIINTNATCSGSIYALHLAEILSLDTNQPVIVICCDNMTSQYHLWHFKSFGALDMDTGRPFDSTSKGFKMGQGIAVFIVKHSKVKYTKPAQALISDFAFYTNPDLIANPGTADDIIKNLSHINYKDVELWNAHATGTPVGDIVEYKYFNAVCGPDVPIVSYKGIVGHCMSAAGGIEIAMMLDDQVNNQLRPNNIQGNKIVIDDRIITEPMKFDFKTVLKANLGFGGKTAVAKIHLQ